MKKLIKKVMAIALTVSIAAMMVVTGTTMASAESSTGVGLAAHALQAYREGWSYVWGGCSYGAVDCSGLIASYNGVGGSRMDMLASSDDWGYVSNGIPRIHGLGLHQPGHIGVYLGSGMAVDARDEISGVVYHNVASKSWAEWFKVKGVSYPTNGWVLFDGESYYYEDGQYIVNTSRTLNGVTYSFDGSGASNIAPPSSAYEATDYSSNGSSSNKNNSNKNNSNSNSSKKKQKSSKQESSKEESSKQESSKQESSKEESSKQESSKQESSKEESSKQESSKEESSKQESSKQESSKQESSKTDSKKTTAQKEEPVKTIASYGDEDNAKSKTVASVQDRLYELGYLTSKSSGYFGEDTVNAVMLFQNINKLDVTGIVDSKTYKVLKSTSAKSNFSLLESGAFDDGQTLSITALQKRLTELKYYYDDVTGYYGDLTASAVKQFQSDNKLKATGVADPTTQAKIFAKAAKVNPNAGSVKYGQSGAMILKMQKRLIELRYLSGVVNEKFDNATLSAVNAYQAAAGLKKSQTMTSDQLDALYSKTAPKSPNYNTLQYGFTGDDVAELQSRLATLKYYDGKTSGVYSQAVQAAVENFQKDNKLSVTGNADNKTLNTVKTEAQRASSQVGEQLIIQTASIADNALAGLANTKSDEVAVISQSQNDIAKTAVVFVIVIAFAGLLSIIFIVELKKKKRLAAAKALKTSKIETDSSDDE